MCSSIADGGTGKQTITYTNSMSNDDHANYCTSSEHWWYRTDLWV